MRSLIRSLLALTIIAASLALTVATAAACSCMQGTDDEYFGWADAVFIGELTDYEFVEDPDGDGEMSSGDPAVWTFAVDEVLKGTVADVQPVISAVSGATCGLEIPRTGTFLVFANETADGAEFDLGPGELSANLCGGTRSADISLQLETVPTTTSNLVITETLEVAAAAEDEPVDTESGGIVFIIGFLIVGVGGAVVASRLVKKNREW